MLHHFERLFSVSVVVAAIGITVAYLNTAYPSNDTDFGYAYAGLLLGGGVLAAREVADLIAKVLRPELGKNVLVTSNVVAIGGYIVSAATAASYPSFSPTALLAGAAFSGLVLGLALQSTQGSFFADSTGEPGENNELAHPFPVGLQPGLQVFPTKTRFTPGTWRRSWKLVSFSRQSSPKRVRQ